MPDEDFNPFASAPAAPQLEETTDDIDFDQFLTTLSESGFSYDSTPVEQPPVEEGEDDTPAEDEPQDQPPASTVSTVRIGESDVPLEEVQLLYELGKTIREQGITAPPAPAAETPPPAEPPAPPEPETPPEWLDTDDPVQMGMWSELKATRQETAIARAESARFIAEQNQSRITQEVNAGIRAFHEAHPQLTDQEVQTIATLAAPTVSAFVRASATPIEGIAKAMRLTALDFEPTRDRVLGLAQKSGQQKSAERKSKQGSLTPSGSGSAPRDATPRSAPRTDRAATEEFAKELASSFGTNGRLN